MGAEASKPGDYTEPPLPEGVLEIRISVYKIELTGVALLDEIGAGITGAYHSGLVVGGKEYSFGGHGDEGKSGVFSNEPEMNKCYIFFRRLVMGGVRADRDAVRAVIKKMALESDWFGTSYDLLERNCNHFTSELCWRLIGRRPPRWINRTADNLTRKRIGEEIETEAVSAALIGYRQRFGPPGVTSELQAIDQHPREAFQVPNLPGANAFHDTFRATFRLVWTQHLERIPKLHDELEEPQDVDTIWDLGAHPEDDPHEVRIRAMEAAQSAATLAATLAATAVAAASREAFFARRQQPTAGLEAWDAAWIRESRPLLKAWREAAIAGQLVLSDDGHEGAPSAEHGDQLEAAAGLLRPAMREEQVRKALAAAAKAADAAAGVFKVQDRATVQPDLPAEAIEGKAEDVPKVVQSSSRLLL